MHSLAKQLVQYIHASTLLYLIVTTATTTYASSSSSSTVQINCTFEDINWNILGVGFGVIFGCECKERIKVTERNTIVSNVTGIHAEHANNSHVQSIHIIGASYVPKGIETFFPNLIALSFQQHLKEITPNDLKPFPKLVHFWVTFNRLEVIEKDLFKYNPELRVISMKHNFIKQIDSNVFDHLNRLGILELALNDCIDVSAVARYQVYRLIQQTKEVCAPGQVVPIIDDNEKLNDDENQILNEEMVFWKNFTIVLLSLVVLVMGIGVFILIKKHGVTGVEKFVSFRNS